MKKIFRFMTLAFSIAILFGMVGSTTFASSTNSFDSEVREALDAEDKVIWDGMGKYIVLNENGVKTFDIEKAKENNESEELLEYGYVFNEFAQTTAEKGEITTFAPNVLVYGNYCGLGNKGGSPIDNLDTACLLHDDCYTHGGNNAACNRRFVQDLLPIIQVETFGTYKHTVALAAAKYFAQDM